jgi:hypothetical protein
MFLMLPDDNEGTWRVVIDSDDDKRHHIAEYLTKLEAAIVIHYLNGGTNVSEEYIERLFNRS